jgi:hypothetical protein
MIRKLSSLAVAAALAFIPLAASAAITPGTQLTGSLDQSLDSKGAQVGQRFTMSNVHSQDNNINNARIYGHVCDVRTAGQGTPGKIQLCFDKLVTASGTSYKIDGRATDVKVVTKSNVGNEVGGAVAGLILGNIVGKKLGTNVGGLLGAAGGYVYAKNARQQVTIPQNSLVTVQVLRAYRQASHG